jgi:hypothetical protein
MSERKAATDFILIARLTGKRLLLYAVLLREYLYAEIIKINHKPLI